MLGKWPGATTPKGMKGVRSHTRVDNTLRGTVAETKPVTKQAWDDKSGSTKDRAPQSRTNNIVPQSVSLRATEQTI